MKTKRFLGVSALVEGIAGLALLIAPAATLALLLGAGSSPPRLLVLARIAGAALLAIGITCWRARHGERRGAKTGLLTGLVVYNLAVAALLLQGTAVDGMHAIALWPVAVLHAALLVWCLACLRPRSHAPSRRPQGQPVHPTGPQARPITAR